MRLQTPNPPPRRGKCDDALLECTNKNSLFKIQSRYVVERCDPELWDKVRARACVCVCLCLCACARANWGRCYSLQGAQIKVARRMVCLGRMRLTRSTSPTE